MTTESEKLAAAIKKAIEDCELTTTEYDQILAQANADQVLDNEEKALLRQLQDMLSNGMVKRVPG